MGRRLLPVLVLTLYFLIFSFFLASSPSADNLPANPTCDLCGSCRDASGNLTKPPDWQKCRQCIYGSTDPASQPIEGKSWTPLGCIEFTVGQAGGFVQTVLRFVVGIAGGLAFLGFLWGGFELLTAAGDPWRIEAGRNTILAAGGALLLILFAVFLLQFIGFTILGIPGFGR